MDQKNWEMIYICRKLEIIPFLTTPEYYEQEYANEQASFYNIEIRCEDINKNFEVFVKHTKIIER